ncbi:tail protein [Microcystis phage Mwe-Yong1]|nr:tail protein [Microcystis phage Mwe-Yong1]
MADIVTAIVDILKADAGVALLCGARVFGGELPAAEAKAMPRYAIVVQPSGGVPFAPGSRVDLEQQRFDVVAYGGTIFEASALRAAAARCLQAVQRQISAGVLVHWVQSAGGMLAGRDRDGQWPYAFQSFQSLFATDEVA